MRINHNIAKDIAHNVSHKFGIQDITSEKIKAKTDSAISLACEVILNNLGGSKLENEDLKKIINNISSDTIHNISQRIYENALLPEILQEIVKTETENAIMLVDHAINDLERQFSTGEASEARQFEIFSEKRKNKEVRNTAKELNQDYNAESETAGTICTKLDGMRQQVKTDLSDLGTSSNWNNVLDTTSTLASINNKPDYSDGVTETVDRFTKTQNRKDTLNSVGLNSNTLSSDLETLASLYALGENIPTELGRSKRRFTPDEQKRYTGPIIEANTTMFLIENLNHLPNIEKFIEATADKGGATKSPLETAGLIVRDIAAMEAPREFRKRNDNTDEDGRVKPHSIAEQIHENIESKNYDPEVTKAMVKIYREDKGV